MLSKKLNLLELWSYFFQTIGMNKRFYDYFNHLSSRPFFSRGNEYFSYAFFKNVIDIKEKAFQKENFMVSSFTDAESILKNFDTINPDIILSLVLLDPIYKLSLVLSKKLQAPSIAVNSFL